MSPPLRSRQRDPHLQSATNGISYNQEDSAEAPGDGSAGSNQNDTITNDDDNDDLETPREFDLDAPVLLNGTHNANNGTHNAQQCNLHNEGAADVAITACHHNPKLVSIGTHNAQQCNLHNEGAADVAITACHHNPKLVSTHILKIQPALKAQMRHILGRESNSPLVTSYFMKLIKSLATAIH
jgi:hypothetical protein